MMINYYQLETLARIHHEERLAIAARHRLIARKRASLPVIAWAKWLTEQKGKWVAPRRPVTIEPAC